MTDRLPTRVLLADDDRATRTVLRRFLASSGLEVMTAEDGLEAVELFEKHGFDIVLLDVMMPRCDGFEATRRIKASINDDFVPVVLLTSLEDQESIQEGLAVGADDFISKPIRRAVLLSRLNASLRTKQLFNNVREQRRRLQQLNEVAEREQKHAETILSRVVASAARETDTVRVFSKPMSICNGDIFMAERTPRGLQRFLLGDFAGHGLVAAIGTLPIISTFRSVTRSGASIQSFVTRANQELHQTLPTGLFLAAIVAEIEPTLGELRVWNAGMPDVAVRSAGGGSVPIHSNSLPLGITKELQKGGDISTLQIRAGDRVYMCSDGMFEVTNDEGERYGEERFYEHLADATIADDALFEASLAQRIAFIGDVPPQDDATLVEVRYDGEVATRDITVGPDQKPERRLTFSLGPAALREDSIMRAVEPVLGTWSLGSRLFDACAVVSEMYMNAIDHGVLGLESHLKRFGHATKFYEERERALARLTEGTIDLTLELFELEAHRELHITVQDSGAGFNYEQRRQVDNDAPHGRGIFLARELADEFGHEGIGSRCVAKLRIAPKEPTEASEVPGAEKPDRMAAAK